jgi:serine/threonine protein kinase
MHDFVKVLDFGLVKAMDGADQAHLTNPNAITGTPLYLSPEGVNQPDKVDARTDVYALAAVGYYLLTGTPVFTGTTVMEICMKHVKAEPEAPSVRSGKPVSVGLEALLLQSLAKAPADRPMDAADLLRKLEGCVVEGAWTAADAADWWARRGDIAKASLSPAAQVPRGQETPAPDATMAFQRDGEQSIL